MLSNDRAEVAELGGKFKYGVQSWPVGCKDPVPVQIILKWDETMDREK